MGPISSTVAVEPITATRVSSTVASRRVPRNACQANIGITANTTGGASVIRKTASVVPSVSVACTMRSRWPGDRARS